MARTKVPPLMKSWLIVTPINDVLGEGAAGKEDVVVSFIISVVRDNLGVPLGRVAPVTGAAVIGSLLRRWRSNGRRWCGGDGWRGSRCNRRCGCRARCRGWSGGWTRGGRRRWARSRRGSGSRCRARRGRGRWAWSGRRCRAWRGRGRWAWSRRRCWARRGRGRWGLE